MPANWSRCFTIGGLTLTLAFVPATVQEQTLYNFAGGNDGATSYAPLAAGVHGTLYGTTYYGGASGAGTVFEMKPAGSTYSESVLYAFQNKTDGGFPYAGLTPGSGGAFFGTTTQGGTLSRGVVFKLKPTGSGYAELVMYSFLGGKDGAEPYGGLTFDKKGDLFGTTQYGGSAGHGTVFELKPEGQGYAESLVYSFTGGSDGGYPVAGVIADAHGALYGTTFLGGSGSGVVFKLTPVGSAYSETVLYSFGGGTDGAKPNAPLIADAKGGLYGSASSGGAKKLGVAFKLTPMKSGYVETVLHDFAGHADGATPVSALLAEKDGALFGTTLAGGAHGSGTLFELTPSGSKYTESVLYSFSGGNDGGSPYASLIVGPKSSLFGTSSVGGTSNYGTVFELIP